MPTRPRANDSADTSPDVPPSDGPDPELAARHQALRLEREPTDYNDPAAVAGWCRKAHAFLAAYVQSHEDCRHHHGDGVCHIIARAAYARAHGSPFCPVELVRLLGPQPMLPPWIAGTSALANLQRLAQCAHGPPLTSAPACPPLTASEQRVLDLIQALPPGQGLPGRRIITLLAKEGFVLDQGTLTRHIIPKLKRYAGVKNRSGVGYYCAPA